MQSQYGENQSLEATEEILDIKPNPVDTDELSEQTADELGKTPIEPTRFHGFFEDCMEMYADAQTVAEYLNAHQGWFGIATTSRRYLPHPNHTSTRLRCPWL